MSVEARDRKIEIWYNKIRYGEIKLPRFQRHEAWDKDRISSLLTTIIHDLPLGITLILEVDKEQFISRYISTAEKQPPYPKVNEHLLDGQQRLTALWRALHNNYEWDKYFLYLPEYDKYWTEYKPTEDEDEEQKKTSVIHIRRWISDRRKLSMPLWADIPYDCLIRGCIPMDLLRPEDIGNEIADWINAAMIKEKPVSGSENYEQSLEQYMEKKKALNDTINSFRETVKHYNLPFLALPSDTSKDTALNVFINMNTNSKPLTQYDIIVAEIEGLKDTSLHELQELLRLEHPAISRYFNLSYLILYTSALMQDKVPNKKGIWEMDKNKVVENWESMVDGLSRMARFMESNRIFDEDRLPTNAVLAVISALYASVQEKGDIAGKLHVLLRKYLWSSFFTDRYENSAASRAYADYSNMLNYIRGRAKSTGQSYIESDIPVLNRTSFPLATSEELLHVTWPKRVSIRGRGILAVANYFGALDFADGSTISSQNIKEREYHHIYPDSLVQDAVLYHEELNSTVALNCALITDKTNRNIGKKDPLKYLTDRFEWSNESIVNQRLHSHLIPVKELMAGDYEGLSAELKANKIKEDYERFLSARASIIIRAVNKLTEGEEVSIGDGFLSSPPEGAQVSTE